MVLLRAMEKTVHPLELRWQGPHDPLPIRFIQGTRRSAMVTNDSPGQPWIATGPAEKPFHFCAHISRLAEDIVVRMPEFRHIKVPRILFGALQARNGHPHGLQARVTPLRFAHGQLQRPAADPPPKGSAEDFWGTWNFCI